MDGAVTPARPLDGGWRFRRAGDDTWQPAHVPGCVHTDLLAAGAISDPFYGTNERDLQWIEREDWEYRTIIALDEATLAHDRLDLAFDGLDTYAEVRLGGAVVLESDNMFVRHRVPAKARLRPGDNELLVRFTSPMTRARPAYEALRAHGIELPAINDQGEPRLSPFVRKAPYHFGWDWGPRFVTCGIWRPARLEPWNDARIDDVHVVQRTLDDDRARLQVRVRLEAARATEGLLVARVDGGEAARAPIALRPGRNEAALALTIEGPRRWWPNGLGDPHLYGLEVTLETPRARQTHRTRFGLRTIRLRRERDEAGKSFTFEVNGVPLFAKGANFIPADSFPSRVTPARLRALVDAAADVHMNMLRVWGGGLYEDDAFYDACDERGLLVWQDFMFACSLYPDDDGFLARVRREAIDNVERLRGHACLALWCGNNEVEAAWHHWGWKLKAAARGKARRLWRGYRRLFHELLPAVVEAHDPSRPYTRSSPSANEETGWLQRRDGHVNQRGWGDMHYWGVWHSQEPKTAYDDNVSRFMSEYGFQSFPELATVATYAPPEALRLDSEIMRAHQRHPRGNELIAAYLERDYPNARDFETFLYLGQLLQAEVITYAVEAHRLARPRCMGSLFWQLDDCWPVASWSSIDHLGRWKALHHRARRFFAPVLVVVRSRGDEVVVHGVSDVQTMQALVLSLHAITFTGETLFREDHPVRLAAGASSALLRLSQRELLGGHRPESAALVAELREGPVVRSRKLFFFVPAKALALPRARVEARADRSGAAVSLTLVSPTLAPHAWLTAGGPGHFSDNALDLLPGAPAAVTFTPAPTAAAPDVETFLRGLRVTTLADAL